MPKMKAVQVPRAGGGFEVVEREVPQAGPGQVRIRVQACGVCHSDVVTKEGPAAYVRRNHDIQCSAS